MDKNDQLINMTKVELLIDLIKNASNKFETYSDVSSQNVSKVKSCFNNEIEKFGIFFVLFTF